MELLKQLLKAAGVKVPNLDEAVRAKGLDPANLSDSDAKRLVDEFKGGLAMGSNQTKLTVEEKVLSSKTAIFEKRVQNLVNEFEGMDDAILAEVQRRLVENKGKGQSEFFVKDLTILAQRFSSFTALVKPNKFVIVLLTFQCIFISLIFLNMVIKNNGNHNQKQSTIPNIHVSQWRGEDTGNTPNPRAI